MNDSNLYPERRDYHVLVEADKIIGGIYAHTPAVRELTQGKLEGPNAQFPGLHITLAAPITVGAQVGMMPLTSTGV
jgi:hypothetical protein